MPPRKPGEPRPRHLTVKDLADRFGVSEPTVYGWNSKGTGPNFIRNGLLVRYRLEDVEAWERSLLVRQPA
jgi:predicted DNA-binding transcriptional regulator AlpA